MVPGIAGEDGDVQATDVDAQLQRGGAHDAQDLARPQACLDGPSFRGQVPAAVAADPLDGPTAVPQLLLERR